MIKNLVKLKKDETIAKSTKDLWHFSVVMGRGAIQALSLHCIACLHYLFVRLPILATYCTEHEQEMLCKNTDYMNLHFKVNELYFKYAANVPPYKGQIPEYTR